MPTYFSYIFAAVFGLCFGSFANVLALRDNRRESIVTGHSECPTCGHLLRSWELVPVLSYLLQLGRCRSCKAHISLQYPVVEIVTALLAMFLYWFGLIHHFNWLSYLLLGVSLLLFLVISVIDILTQYVPDDYCKIAGVAGILGMINAHLFSVSTGLLGAVVGGAIIAGVLYGWKWLRKEDGMGVGDIFIAASVGAVVGYPNVLIALLAAVFSGAVIGILSLPWLGKKMKAALPFGPFLFFGLLVALIWGNAIVQWYTVGI